MKKCQKCGQPMTMFGLVCPGVFTFWAIVGGLVLAFVAFALVIQ